MARQSKEKAKRGIPKADAVAICTPMGLDERFLVEASRRAIEINPSNAAPEEQVARFAKAMDIEPSPQHLAFLTGKLWPNKGVKLGVSFMEATAEVLRNRILEHMNSWGQFSNVRFSWSQSNGEIRISRGAGGYYSYLGTDCLSINRDRQTMNLQGFTMQTSEQEFRRVVRHETGHTIGCPHEHSRRALIARLDPQKVIAEFGRSQGWSEQMVREQILTPIEESSILSGEPADELSLMAYQFPGSLTRDGRPIPGGMDFSELDKKVAAKIYPLVVNPPPPTDGKWRKTVIIEVDEATNNITLTVQQ